MATIDHVRHHHTRQERLQEQPFDSVRHTRAKGEIRTERDRLVKHGDKKIQASPGHVDSKIRPKILLYALGLTIVVMIPYLVMLAMWFFVFHASFSQTLGVFVVFVIVSSILVVASYPGTLGKERPHLWWIGMGIALSTLVALVAGFVLYYHYLAYHYKYKEMLSYTNVAAAQNAEAFSDGAMYLWTEDTHLDTLRAVGYKSKWTGETYCAAPIVDSSMAEGDDIWYWAIGINCCAQRAEFHCNDASDLSTRSALVALEPKDVVRSWMQWAVKGAEFFHFADAIKLEEAAYYTKAAPKPKLVYWSKDPEALKNTFYSVPSGIATTVSIVYLVLAFIASYVICRYYMLKPKDKSYLFRASV